MTTAIDKLLWTTLTHNTTHSARSPTVLSSTHSPVAVHHKPSQQNKIVDNDLLGTAIIIHTGLARSTPRRGCSLRLHCSQHDMERQRSALVRRHQGGDFFEFFEFCWILLQNWTFLTQTHRHNHYSAMRTILTFTNSFSTSLHSNCFAPFVLLHLICSISLLDFNALLPSTNTA